MRAFFYDSFGTYTFATRDERPTVDEALAYLRWVARTPEGLASLRALLESLELAPKLTELDDEELLVLLAEKVVSGAFSAWEAAPLAPPAAAERRPEPPRQPTPPPRRPAPEQAPLAPPSPQAGTFVEAAKTGKAFCEICERLAREEQAAAPEPPPPSPALAQAQTFLAAARVGSPFCEV